MNIYEAMTQALETGKHMKRRSWRVASVRVERVEVSFPRTAGFDLWFTSESGRWYPQSEDFLAKDWELVAPRSDTEPRRKEYVEASAPFQSDTPAPKSNILRLMAVTFAVISLAISIIALLSK